MKRIILIIIALVLAASTAGAATDPAVHEGIVKLQQLNAQNLAIDPKAAQALYDAGKESAQQDAKIEKLTTDNSTLRSKENSWPANAVGGLGIAILVGGGFFGFVLLKKLDIATGSIVSGLALIALSEVIRYYGHAIALYGMLATFVGVIVYVAWIIVRARKREVAGINHATVVPTLIAAGLPKAWADKATAIVDKLSGDMGDFMTSVATGKTVPEVKSTAQAAQAVVTATATPTMPTNGQFAVTSGVVTPLTPMP